MAAASSCGIHPAGVRIDQLRSFDYVIVGSGIAGLYAALMARDHGDVLVLTKGSIDECNTKYAQGGIAAAVGPDDSPARRRRAGR